MWDIIRDSTFGQCLRLASGGMLAGYPEDQPGFQLPAGSLEPSTSSSSTSSSNGELIGDPEKGNKESNPLVIGWYGENDPENPHNWSCRKKLWVAMLLFVYTFSVYIGSSLYTASEPDVMRIYCVGDEVGELGLTMYVLAYGLGPMLFSPLSEIPAVGRTFPYTVTYFFFVILCIPMALVDNVAGILILRFLLGFFGSPCLATAGASYGDFYGAKEMPYVIALWGGGATLGPVRSFPTNTHTYYTNNISRPSAHWLPDSPSRKWDGVGARGSSLGYQPPQWLSCSSVCPRHHQTTSCSAALDAYALKQVA